MRYAASFLAVFLFVAPAHAHPMDARLSPSGVEFLQDQLVTYVPQFIYPPEIKKDMYACPGDDASFTQRNTAVELSVDAFDVALPEAGGILVDVTLSASLSGEAYFDKP